MLFLMLISLMILSKCDQASPDLWQQLELASEILFTRNWTLAGSGLLISMLEKLSFCLTDLMTLVLMM